MKFSCHTYQKADRIKVSRVRTKEKAAAEFVKIMDSYELSGN
jgi:hypothetical protein